MRPLTEITIEQYKSFSGKATLPFSTLTVLIGANASGKSNALEALRFLSWLAEGQKLSDIRYLIQQGQSVVRGDVSQLAVESCPGTKPMTTRVLRLFTCRNSSA